MRYLILSILALAWSSIGPWSWLQAQAQDWESQRKKMVQEQLQARDIESPEVLQAMLEVPRHKFVPERHQYLAYTDQALPIAQKQTISQPYIVALMTELAQVRKKDKVLEIGTGSGYQAAVLAHLAQEVYSIEIIPELAQGARQLLQELGYHNVWVRTGDGFQGWPEQAPFDSILVTCAPPEEPQPLIDQLVPGGRLVIPVGETWQQLKVLHKQEDGTLQDKTVAPVRFVPMTGPGVQELAD